MRSRFPTRRLILPSALAALLCLVGSAVLPSDWWESFLQNLSTTFIGILLAALYVDEVQRANEDQEWRLVKNSVDRRIKRISALILWWTECMIGDVASRNSNNILRETGDNRSREVRLNEVLPLATGDDFAAFAEAVAEVPDRIEHLIDLYGRFIPRATLEILLALLDEAPLVISNVKTIGTTSLRENLSHDSVLGIYRDALRRFVLQAEALDNLKVSR